MSMAKLCQWSFLCTTETRVRADPVSRNSRRDLSAATVDSSATSLASRDSFDDAAFLHSLPVLQQYVHITCQPIPTYPHRIIEHSSTPKQLSRIRKLSWAGTG